MMRASLLRQLNLLFTKVGANEGVPEEFTSGRVASGNISDKGTDVAMVTAPLIDESSGISPKVISELVHGKWVRLSGALDRRNDSVMQRGLQEHMNRESREQKDRRQTLEASLAHPARKQVGSKTTRCIY